MSQPTPIDPAKPMAYQKAASAKATIGEANALAATYAGRLIMTARAAFWVSAIAFVIACAALGVALFARHR